MDILEKAIKYYGPQNQMMMVLEENAELSQAITKYIRSTKKGQFNEIIKARKNVVEEIADVLIVIEQLKIMLDIQNYEINCVKDYKLNRLKERIEKGEIRLSGKDIREIPREKLRDVYGMVLQDTWICDGTIRENIAFGTPEATDEQIIEAAKAAHAHSFIKKLPQGYDTLIGEGGGNLSQGQKQLLCIARIMLTDPEILILDEATSSIDTRTEIRIQKAFKKLMAGRTAFVVAHRLSTIKESDVILVMRDGNIIEQGTHEELLAQKNFYYKLYNSQFPDVD